MNGLCVEACFEARLYMFLIGAAFSSKCLEKVQNSPLKHLEKVQKVIKNLLEKVQKLYPLPITGHRWSRTPAG